MADSLPLVYALLCRYASLREGKFTRADFIRWGAHHGLSRRTPTETIDAAFTEARDHRLIEQVQHLPEAVYCLFQNRRTA
jgi:hypothetical protein